MVVERVDTETEKVEADLDFDDAVLRLDVDVEASEDDNALVLDEIDVMPAVLESLLASEPDALLPKTEFTMATIDVSCFRGPGVESSKAFT